MLPEEMVAVSSIKQSRKEKRKALKKLKRKQARTDAAIREREAEESRLNDPEEQLRLRLLEQAESEKAERERKEFEERERLWIEAAAARKSREEEDERQKKLFEDEDRSAQKENAYGLEADDEYETVDEGPAEIIWQGNEIIIKKKRVKVPKGITERIQDKEDDDRPTSNPLPPQSAAFASYVQGETAQEMIDNVAQQIPNFGTEQDKAHCPFHLKTGACRFGSRCSRVHFYPDKSCTLLIKNMYNGPGLTCEQDEGLEVCQLMLIVAFGIRNTIKYTDEEVERSYEEFYEDVHTEFLKFGEIVNFKVCKNSSYHLRGNLYVHYKFLESAILAFNTMNARYYAGKQIICDFVGVTRWKVAICGEYMKSRLKTCSHGSACNFIHCFRNPGGDYEWADWDNPPPRYWIKRMIFLFGTSAESGYDKELESVDHKRHNEPKRAWKPKNDRHQSERFHSKEINLSNSSSDGELKSKLRYTKHSIKAEHSAKRRGHPVSEDKNEQPSERHRSEDHFYSKTYCSHSDEAAESTSKEINHDSSKNHRRYAVNILQECDGRHERRSSSSRRKSRRKRKLYSEEHENSESKPRKKLDRTNSKDRGLASGDFNEKYSSEDHDEDEDYDVARYHYGSRPDNRRKYDKHSLRRHRSRQLPEYRRIEESDESPGRWKASDNDFLVEET